MLNNVAIGAQYALLRHNYERVLIVDFDVHHGNGTEQIFRHHSGVAFASVHVYAPEIHFYPCSGPPEHPPAPLSADEHEQSARAVATGSGFLQQSNVLNVPLPLGVTSRQFCDAFENHVLPHMRAFRPQLVLVSAGFDGHCDDPYGQWIGSGITANDYSAVTHMLRDAARECNAPVVSVLEGGYNLNSLRNNVREHCRAMLNSA